MGLGPNLAGRSAGANRREQQEQGQAFFRPQSLHAPSSHAPPFVQDQGLARSVCGKPRPLYSLLEVTVS